MLRDAIHCDTPELEPQNISGLAEKPRRPHNWQPSGTRQERGYGVAHQRLRRQVLAEEPHCRICLATGKITRASVLDHVVPLCLGGPTIRSNVQPACEPCSASKSGREGAMMRKRQHLDRGHVA